MSECKRSLLPPIVIGTLLSVALGGHVLAVVQALLTPSRDNCLRDLSLSLLESQQDQPSEDDRLPKLLLEIKKEHYQECKPLDGPLKVRFDFSGSKVFAFDFSQKTITGTESKPIVSESRGLLLLKSKGNGFGSILLKNPKTSIKDGDSPASSEIESPTLAVPAIHDEGTLADGGKDTQPLLRMLFPVLSKPYLRGEVIELPIQLETNVMGTHLPVHGTQKSTLTKYVSLSGKICARLETQIDISKLEAPKEMEDKPEVSVRGGSVFYFEIETREFVSGEAVFEMKISAGKAKAGADPKKDSPRPNHSAPLTLTSDFVIGVQRNAVKSGAGSD